MELIQINLTLDLTHSENKNDFALWLKYRFNWLIARDSLSSTEGVDIGDNMLNYQVLVVTDVHAFRTRYQW